MRIGREVQQVHDLRNAGKSNVAETGECPVVLNVIDAEQGVEADHECN